jgi:hypothetical protein
MIISWSIHSSHDIDQCKECDTASDYAISVAQSLEKEEVSLYFTDNHYASVTRQTTEVVLVAATPVQF